MAATSILLHLSYMSSIVPWLLACVHVCLHVYILDVCVYVPINICPCVQLLMLGESGTGKTSLLQRFERDEFNDDHLPTIGVDFVVKTCSLPNGDLVKLQVKNSLNCVLS